MYLQLFLQVYTAPEVDDVILSSSNPITVGDFLKIECKASGIPKPIIKWTKVGNEVYNQFLI